MCSAMEANTGSPVHLHLFSDSIRRCDLARLEAVAVRRGAGLTIYEIGERLNAHPKLRASSHYSRAAYARLFIPDLLPPSVQFFVYMDCDVISVRSWLPVWERRSEIEMIGASLDPWVERDVAYRASLGLPLDQSYYGSGVMIVNREGWHAAAVLPKLLQFVEENVTRYIDQDAINVVCGAQITQLPSAFNMLTAYPDSSDLSASLATAINIHFASGLKPWHLGYSWLAGVGAKEFRRAKAHSPWRWLRPEFQTKRLHRKMRQMWEVRATSAVRKVKVVAGER